MPSFRLFSAITVIFSSLVVGNVAGAATKPPETSHKPLSAPLRHPAVHHTTRLVSRAVVDAWARVAVCEEGGWTHSVDGPTYFGSLGWLWATWQMFRRADFPVNMYYATAQQQSWAAQRFVAYYHIGVPDQNGCGGGY